MFPYSYFGNGYFPQPDCITDAVPGTPEVPNTGTGPTTAFPDDRVFRLPSETDEKPFLRLLTTFSPRGTTRVYWGLSPRFVGPEPHVFQLQFSYSGQTDGSWVDVGSEVADTYYLDDDEQRLFGKAAEAFWRIRLYSGGYYYDSPPVCALTAQDWRDWRINRKLIRQEAKRGRYTSVDGYLLKERRYGTKCPTCIDAQTGEVKISNCEDCYGVGFLYGYWPALDGVFCDIELQGRLEEVNNQTSGTTMLPAVTRARLSGIPWLNSRDVFVEKYSGRRWRAENITHAAEIKGVPVVYQVELHQLPFSDPIYNIEVP